MEEAESSLAIDGVPALKRFHFNPIAQIPRIIEPAALLKFSSVPGTNGMGLPMNTSPTRSAGKPKSSSIKSNFHQFSPLPGTGSRYASVNIHRLAAQRRPLQQSRILMQDSVHAPSCASRPAGPRPRPTLSSSAIRLGSQRHCRGMGRPQVEAPSRMRT